MFYGVYLPIARHSLECLAPSIREPQPGARYQILHRSGNQYLASARERCDPCADMNSNPAHIVSHHFTLSSMETGANINSE